MNFLKSWRFSLLAASAAIALAGYALFDWQPDEPAANRPIAMNVQASKNSGSTDASQSASPAGIQTAPVDSSSSTPEGTWDSKTRELLSSLKNESANFAGYEEYVGYTKWCHAERLQPKLTSDLCNKHLMEQYDSIFVKRAEKLAAAGDKSALLLLGLWWQEKAEHTLTEFNIAAKNENLLHPFNYNDPIHQTNQAAYEAGTTLKKQLEQARKWLYALSKDDQAAASALDALNFRIRGSSN